MCPNPPATQFTDLNGDLTAFKRYYTPQIRKADDMEKKLRFFEEEMVRARGGCGQRLARLERARMHCLTCDPAAGARCRHGALAAGSARTSNGRTDCRACVLSP